MSVPVKPGGGKFYCYILYNEKNSLTYVGMTNNIPRRIRQHNTEIEGGAIYTTRMVRKHGVHWKYLCILTFDGEGVKFERSEAMSVEWHLKFLARIKKMYRTHVGRIQSIPAVMDMKKVLMYGQKPTVYVQEGLLAAALQVLPGLTVKPLSDIYTVNTEPAPQPIIHPPPVPPPPMEPFIDKDIVVGGLQTLTVTENILDVK